MGMWWLSVSGRGAVRGGEGGWYVRMWVAKSGPGGWW